MRITPEEVREIGVDMVIACDTPNQTVVGQIPEWSSTMYRLAAQLKADEASIASLEVWVEKWMTAAAENDAKLLLARAEVERLREALILTLITYG